MKSLTNKSKGQRLRKRKRYSFDRQFSDFTRSQYGEMISQIPLKEQAPLPYIKDVGKMRMTQKWYRIFRNKRYQRFLQRIPTFAKAIYGVDQRDMALALAKHINWYEHMVRNKGPVYTVKLLKRVRDACLRFAANHEFERIGELKLYQDGLPIQVGHLMKWLTDKDISRRRAAILVLDIIKLCQVPGELPSTDSITTPLDHGEKITNSYIGETLYVLGKPKVSKETLNKVVSAFKVELRRLFNKKGTKYRLRELTRLSDIHMSVRKGPNGPALGTLVVDYYGIKNGNLLEPIRKMAELTGNIQLMTTLNELDLETSTNPSSFSAEQPPLHSRLALKNEPWCKTRLFAICDWFSQSALKGLHKWIFNWLEKQAEDGTMSQSSVAEIVRKWTFHSGDLQDPEGLSSLMPVSMDLSKATDRLSATLQREILEQIFGKEVSDIWYTICTDRQFQTPQGEWMSFKAGQPLGVYSSWAMLALTHHLICRTALRLSGSPRVVGEEPRYAVIGDDVALRNEKLGECYSLIMNVILQVPISEIKGFTPKTCLSSNSLNDVKSKSSSAEIAKRVFVDGKELSIVSPETLKSGFEYPMDFPNLIHQLTDRGCLQTTQAAVAPFALASLGFKPRVATTFATFPLRHAVSEESVITVLGSYEHLMNHIPWFDRDIPINRYELESMFRWSIRDSLQKTLDKFRENFRVYTDVCQTPIKVGDRVYRSAVQEYVSRFLLNKAMYRIIELVEETDVLNFEGPGMKLDEIVSELNTMTDFDLALRGKPPVKKENLHRLRSRTISSLQPLVAKTIKKAKENFGILLIDSRSLNDFNLRENIDIANKNLEIRGLLKHVESRLSHDLVITRLLDSKKRRSNLV